jgi:hypothetical protein
MVVFLPNTDMKNNSVRELTYLTKLPGIALSTTYLQKRVIYYDDYSNKLYPQMKNYSKVNFVYVK